MLPAQEEWEPDISEYELENEIDMTPMEQLRDALVADSLFTVPEGQKVLLFLGAANRDPRKWERPDEFDVARDTSDHLAMGAGIHGCVGQLVARLEAECVLIAFAERWESFDAI